MSKLEDAIKAAQKEYELGLMSENELDDTIDRLMALDIDIEIELTLDFKE